jgi:hypothetical protein
MRGKTAGKVSIFEPAKDKVYQNTTFERDSLTYIYDLFEKKDDTRPHLQACEHSSRATLARDIGSDSETRENVSEQ